MDFLIKAYFWFTVKFAYSHCSYIEWLDTILFWAIHLFLGDSLIFGRYTYFWAIHLFGWDLRFSPKMLGHPVLLQCQWPCQNRRCVKNTTCCWRLHMCVVVLELITQWDEYLDVLQVGEEKASLTPLFFPSSFSGRSFFQKWQVKIARCASAKVSLALGTAWRTLWSPCQRGALLVPYAFVF